MAAEHAADNQQTLEAQLGRNVTSTDLYLAHFLGVGGAAKFLRAHDQNPGASAAAVLPSAASANRWVFYDRNGAPRSLAEVRQRFAEKLGDDSGALASARSEEHTSEFQSLMRISYAVFCLKKKKKNKK